MSKHTLSVLVEDKPGVLARIAGLFSRRGFNIDSLAVGPTEHSDISRMTVVVDVEELPLEQVTKQLNKLVEVLKVVELDPNASVQRQVVLIKVRADPTTRSSILETVELFRAKVDRRRARQPDHRVHRQVREGPGAAARPRAVRCPRARAVRHRRRRPRPAVDHRPEPAHRLSHLHTENACPSTRRSWPRWPRCSTTTMPTCPSSRARRSPSSATAARATPTRSTCATPVSTSASASPRAASPRPRRRPRA